jgi:hypothetical protein
MLTLKEIAQDWGCTPQYVSLCVKQGCPKEDFESARLWRNAHTTRASKKDPVKNVTPGLHSIPLEEQLARQYTDDPKIIAELAELFKTIVNSARAAEAAWQMLDEAFVEGKPSKISMLLNLHSKAVEARVKAERMVREELERRGILIPLTEAKTKVRRVCEIIVSRLSAMPQNIAPRCNPHNPEHAMQILQEECVAILADAQKAALA